MIIYVVAIIIMIYMYDVIISNFCVKYNFDDDNNRYCMILY